MKSILIAITLCVVYAVPCWCAHKASPKLVVFISVDQMRPDYFTRFTPALTGGLRHLYEAGIVYTNCSLGYASSETGPGHATMSTGCYPNKSGILLNDWYDRKSRRHVYCVTDSLAKPVKGLGGYNSPANLEVLAIGDWLKVSSPLSRVISLSMKERAAILMGGKFSDAAIWYDKGAGKMVSSSYYCDSLPRWVTEFNSQDIRRRVPDRWVKYPDSLRFSGETPDAMEGESTIDGGNAFPHAFLESTKARRLAFTPYGDSLLLELAKDALSAEKLGTRETPDLLCLSLSSTDYVGHLYGPNSAEMHDQIVRLDAWLERFFLHVDDAVGKGNYLVVLTGDHGTTALPSYRVQYQQEKSALLDKDTVVLVQMGNVDKQLRAKLGATSMLIDSTGFLNYEEADRLKLTKGHFQDEVRAALKSLPFVGEVYFRDELLSHQGSSSTWREFYRRSYFAERGPDFVIHFDTHYTIKDGDYRLMHGTPQWDDRHVPLIFWSSSTRPRKVDAPVDNVDIAPTLAYALHCWVPPGIDGKKLAQVCSDFDRQQSERRNP